MTGTDPAIAFRCCPWSSGFYTTRGLDLAADPSTISTAESTMVLLSSPANRDMEDNNILVTVIVVAEEQPGTPKGE